MSNAYRDWLGERKDEALDCVVRIASFFNDYHYDVQTVYEKSKELLKEYEFID